MSLRCIIVDDERSARENLTVLIGRHCPELSVIGSAASVAAARELICTHSPDVVFLDVEMPRENGIELLNSFPAYTFSVVFVTAYDHYALRALKANAVDYLLKPVEISELKKTTEKLLRLHSRFYRSQEASPAAGAREGSQPVLSDSKRRITLAHNKGFKVVDPEEIIRLEADSNYTIVYLEGGRKMIVTSTLKEFEDALGTHFFRTHKSHIVNLKYMDEYTSEDGGYIVLKDGSRVEVSRRKFPEFLEYVSRVNTSLRH